MTLNVRWEDFGQTSGPGFVGPPTEDQTVLTKNYEVIVLAKRQTVTINDYTKADTFDAEIDYKNFPFDPRTIRAIGVTVHMEDREAIFKRDNRLDLLVPSPENTLFTGFADEESIDFDDTSRTVRFEGRDFTSLLIDQPYNGKAIDTGTPLQTVIQQILDALPEGMAENITIDNRTGSPLPTIAKFAPDFSALGKSRSGKKKEFVWDVIQDLVQKAALIAYIELDKLVISKPRVLYGNQTPTQFVYGINLRSLSFKRKVGRQKGINIVVRSLHPEKKTLLEAKIPEEATKVWSDSIGVPQARVRIPTLKSDGNPGKPQDAPFMSFSIPNVVNKDQLISIGEGIYEEIGRQQLEGSLETKDMCTIQDGVEVDLLKLRNGTPISIEIDQGDMRGVMRIKSFADRRKFLIERCYEPAIAAAFASSLGKFETRFYTKSVEYTMDNEEGFSFRLEFLNFIELDNKGLR